MQLSTHNDCIKEVNVYLFTVFVYVRILKYMQVFVGTSSIQYLTCYVVTDKIMLVMIFSNLRSLHLHLFPKHLLDYSPPCSTVARAAQLTSLTIPRTS